MKTTKISLIIIFLTSLIIACQEYDVSSIDLIDEDMEKAIALADKHQVTVNGRTDAVERSITVFKYKYGKVYFDTNTDDYEGYQVLQETSVTSRVKPGEYVYWYSGDGISDLDDVVFDEDSRGYLEDLPEEYDHDRMWVLRLPSKYDDAHRELKYDIIYRSNDSKQYIRLDPKIQVKN